MTKLRHKLGIAFVSLLVSLVCAEGLVRVVAPQPTDYFYFPARPQPSSSFKRWGIEIKLNSLGFRDDDHTVEKPPGVLRIAVLGDSITFGTGVEFADIYHQKLERILNERGGARYEVLAFNQGASSTYWSEKTFKESAREFAPDIVVLGFCLNDFIENVSNAGAASPRTAGRSVYDGLAWLHQRLRVWSHLYFLVFERSRRVIYQRVLDRTVRTGDHWIAATPNAPDHKAQFERGLETTAAMLRQMALDVKAAGAKLIVVVFPFEMQISDEAAALYEREYGLAGLKDATRGEAQAALERALEGSGIEIVNLLPEFQSAARGRSSSLYFRELGGMLDWVHPNAEGHALAAEVLSRRITAAGLQR